MSHSPGKSPPPGPDHPRAPTLPPRSALAGDRPPVLGRRSSCRVTRLSGPVGPLLRIPDCARPPARSPAIHLLLAQSATGQPRRPLRPPETQPVLAPPPPECLL